MRSVVFFIACLALAGCFLKKKKVILESGGGMVITPIDSSLKKEVHIIHLGNAIGVIFPAQYAQKNFQNNIAGQSKVYFTPDSLLIKRINIEVDKQYCTTRKKFNSRFWGQHLTGIYSDTAKFNLTQKQQNIIDEISSNDCNNWSNMSVTNDRQYMGYILNGEKIIWIKLIDFKEDPHHLKQMLDVSWIDGWHGWFYSNITELYFHVDKNLLSIDERLDN